MPDEVFDPMKDYTDPNDLPEGVAQPHKFPDHYAEKDAKAAEAAKVPEPKFDPQTGEPLTTEAKDEGQEPYVKE